MPKATAIKFGLDVDKKTPAGRHINTRGKKTQRVVEEIDVESDAWPSDDSEDSDYEASDVEADSDMELDCEDEYILMLRMRLILVLVTIWIHCS